MRETREDDQEDTRQSNNAFLSQADFQKTITGEPVMYKAGERITRENFASFLISAFAISLGDPNLFELYFEWLKKNEHFDAKKTIKNFLKSGGWDCFSPAEKTLFFTAVQSRKRHREVQDKLRQAYEQGKISEKLRRNFETEEQVGQELKSELGRLFNSFSVFPPAVEEGELLGMPLKTFIKRTKEYKQNPPEYVPEYRMSGH